MSDELPIIQGFLRGKFPGERRMAYLFVEVFVKEVRIYVGCKDATESKRMHLRSLIINDHDSIGELQCKWYQRKRYKFFIDRTDGLYIFECDSADECSTWISCLQQDKQEQPQERRRSLDECTPPHKDVLFHVPPEEVDSVVEDSAYTESDWETLVQSMWFWGYMNRGDCEVKLYNEGKMGDFVVRINSNEQLAMSLWCSNGVKHHLIVLREGCFQFQKSACGTGSKTLIDMLQNFIATSKESIHPFGDNMFAVDSNYTWKKKGLALSGKPTSNSYNLVKLKPNSKKRFEVEDCNSVKDIASSSVPTFKQSTLSTSVPTSSWAPVLSPAQHSKMEAITSHTSSHDSEESCSDDAEYENWPVRK